MKKLIALIAVLLSISTIGFGQQKERLYAHQWSILSGLTQPFLLNGFNLAVNYTTNRWIFEYSHGMSLDYTGPALKAAYRDNIVQLSSPFSTGAGVGYRFFAKPVLGLDIRAEAKVHRYEAQLNESEAIAYHNFDLGGGAYLQIRPFGKKDNGLAGFVIEPSIRYWKNVSSDLTKGFTYTNSAGILSSHEPYPLDLFFNISLGYTFGQ